MKPTWPLMMGFQGTAPGDPGVQQACRYLEEGLLVGLIFFAHNITSPAQIQKLTETFLGLSTPFPPLLAIDQEGGCVQRLSTKNGFASFPSALEVAETCPPEEARELYRTMAQQTRAAGFNYVFGPVVDWHTPACPIIGRIKRSYGDDLTSITTYAKAFIEAHREAGVRTCLKHFPGHGLAQGDTHLGWVDVTKSYEGKEQAPFDRLMAEGYGDSLMSSHLFHQEWDPRFPVSLSASFMPRVLRQESAYDGMVVTDDLHMGALGQRFDLNTILRQALLAQNDMLIFSSNPIASGNAATFQAHTSLPEDLPAYLARFISEGHLTREHVATAWRRLEAFRAPYAQRDRF